MLQKWQKLILKNLPKVTEICKVQTQVLSNTVLHINCVEFAYCITYTSAQENT